MKKKRLQYRGNARFLMMLARDVRRRWQQYGENREFDLKRVVTKCVKCPNRAIEWDHIEPVGSRPYEIKDLPTYIDKMLYNKCQPLCNLCNRKKGDKNETNKKIT